MSFWTKLFTALNIGRFHENNSALSWSERRLVEQLQLILGSDEENNKPIDLSKSPASIEKLKKILLKQLASGDAQTSLPSQEQTILHYLGLSRFYKDWDELDCAKVFLHQSKDPLSTLTRLANCIDSDQAQKSIKAKRRQLEDELVRAGFGR